MASSVIRIDQELDRRLEHLARITGFAKTDCVKTALETYLAHYEWLIENMRDDDSSAFPRQTLNVAFAKWGKDR